MAVIPGRIGKGQGNRNDTPVNADIQQAADACNADGGFPNRMLKGGVIYGLQRNSEKERKDKNEKVTQNSSVKAPES